MAPLLRQLQLVMSLMHQRVAELDYQHVYAYCILTLNPKSRGCSLLIESSLALKVDDHPTMLA